MATATAPEFLAAATTLVAAQQAVTDAKTAHDAREAVAQAAAAAEKAALDAAQATYDAAVAAARASDPDWLGTQQAFYAAVAAEIDLSEAFRQMSYPGSFWV